MERGFILLVAALVVCVSQSVQGTGHLSFSNNTQVNISRDGCGSTKLCVEMPTSCDPTGQSDCLFVSAANSPPVAPNGFELSVELRGESTGYIALGLNSSASTGKTMLFICAANRTSNGFFFRTMTRNDSTGALTPNEMLVREIRGMVNGSVIKCEFIIRELNATNPTIRTSHVTTFTVSLGNGTVSGNTIEAFTPLLTRGPLNLASPTVPTTATPTTTNSTATNTTMPNSGGAVQPHAVLLLLGVLTLPVFLRA